MTDTQNPHLRVVLDLARDIQAESTGKTKKPAAALRYAVLKYLEIERDLPITVCYGDAQAVKQECGREDSAVWEMVPETDETLFYVEYDGEMDEHRRNAVHQTFEAIGGWYLGWADARGNVMRDLRLWYWPTDHPVTELLEDPE